VVSGDFQVLLENDFGGAATRVIVGNFELINKIKMVIVYYLGQKV